MRCSFCGKIDEIPFIRLDNFEDDEELAYFVSHFHRDHLYRLNNLQEWRLKRNKAFIYASEVTIAIIKASFQNISPRYLKVLELGTNTVPIITKDGQEILLEVKMLPAGHSLGSVMFLFKYNKQKILYTGDFRLSKNTVSSYTHFHDKGEPIKLDALYVDTTMQYTPTFPRRSEVIRDVVYHIRNWLDRGDDHTILLTTSAVYGYEYLCNAIYDEIGIKTYVPGYWHIYSQFPKEIYGVTNDETSKIILCSKRDTTNRRIVNEKYNAHIKLQQRLELYFSAMKWGGQRGTNLEEEFLSIENNKIEVCYATHCSRDELLYLINYLKPTKIRGFPEPFDPDIDGIILKEDGFPSLEAVAAENFRITPKKRKVVRKRNVSDQKKACKKLLKEAFDW